MLGMHGIAGLLRKYEKICTESTSYFGETEMENNLKALGICIGAFDVS
jgi:hypothetical protein